MKFSAKIVFVFLACILVLSACSDDKAGPGKGPSTKGAAIALTVKEKATTDSGAATTATLNEDVEKAISSSLTRSLINGSTDTEIFTPAALASAAADFPNNKKAKKNDVTASYYYLQSGDNNQSIVVADVVQDVTKEDGTKAARAGKIFFDPTGVIIGYSFSDTPPATQVQS